VKRTLINSVLLKYRVRYFYAALIYRNTGKKEECRTTSTNEERLTGKSSLAPHGARQKKRLSRGRKSDGEQSLKRAIPPWGDTWPKTTPNGRSGKLKVSQSAIIPTIDATHVGVTGSCKNRKRHISSPKLGARVL